MLRLLRVLPLLLVAADWPQWLGPNRDGSVPEAFQPWTAPPKELWTAEVGPGNSSPIVVGGKLFLHTKANDTEDRLQAFDAKTGTILWDKTTPKAKFNPPFGNGPRATPSYADGAIYSLGNTGVLVAWDAATGKELWKVDTLAELKAPNLFFGVSASPLVVGEMVVVMVGKGATFAAFNRADGKLLWKSGTESASYAAPIFSGGEVVALTGANLTGMSPKDGSIRWQYPFTDALNESSATPVKLGDAYLAASVKTGGALIKPTMAKPELLWKNPELTCYFSTPVAVDAKHLYVVTGIASITKAAIDLRCVRIADGKEVWKKPGIGKYHAALYKQSDGTLLMHVDSGELKLLAQNVEKYEEKASSKICGGTWAHPAIADGRIFVRDDKQLKCVIPSP